jgi:ElaB/YqjD/DUF883 family membrane-anchored ribosome-binding protein
MNTDDNSTYDTNGSAWTGSTGSATAEKWRDAAEECCAAGAERMRNAAEFVEDFVRAQPVKSLLIAAGVGLLAGLLILRRK